MDFQKIPPEQLEVGMKVVVAYPVYHGWHSYTGLTEYDYYTISRITPKKTKVVCGDDEFLTKDTTFYAPHEEMSVENRRVKAFINIRDFMRELDRTSPTKFIGTVDEMEEAVKMAKTFLTYCKEERTHEDYS